MNELMMSANYVGELYKVIFKHSPEDMYVMVFDGNDDWKAECNYGLCTKFQSTPYFCSRRNADKKKAIDLVLVALKPSNNFAPNEYGWQSMNEPDIIYLGNGDKIYSNEFWQ